MIITLTIDLQIELSASETYVLAGFSVLMVYITITDMKGMTSIYKSDLHEDRLFTIKIHQEQCTGIGDCEMVCPRNCFEFTHDVEYITIPRIDDCVQCGACIVQCLEDALYFENSQGEIIEAEIIRKYKLNLLGKRNSKACSCTIYKIVT